jgi:tetraacyldisaccharide 4'-kinase
MSAGRAINQIWYGGGLAAWLLAPFAWLYYAVTGVRRAMYAAGWLTTQHVGLPVVVVGNLTVGGTGKTPLVAWLAERLQERQLSVGILSRGYGRSGEAPRVVESDSNWRDEGDEPLLLRQRTGCVTVVSTDRIAGAKLLRERGVDVILADDGLQHLRLARDCEIVVVDGARGFGNGRLLPAGPLREPASKAADVDLIVINGVPEHASLAAFVRQGGESFVEMTLAPGNALPVAGVTEPRPVDSFRGRRVHAVAGIGHPARFFAELRRQGLDVIEHPFADHHPFGAADLEFGDDAPILMTEKDAVKCRAFAQPGWWYLPVSARFTEAQASVVLERVIGSLRRAVPAS